MSCNDFTVAVALPLALNVEAIPLNRSINIGSAVCSVNSDHCVRCSGRESEVHCLWTVSNSNLSLPVIDTLLIKTNVLAESTFCLVICISSKATVMNAYNPSAFSCSHALFLHSCLTLSQVQPKQCWPVAGMLCS